MNFTSVDITWKDDGSMETVVISDEDTLGTEIDELVFCSGFTADELQAEADGAAELGEDWRVIRVNGTSQNIDELL